MKGFFPSVIFFFLCCRRIALSTDPQFKACEPRDCGNGLYIRYPFRILDQPSYCGYKGFELDCKNGRPVLNMSNNDHYYIQNIFYENQTLLLVNMDLLDNETCLRPTHNLTLENRYFNVSSATTYLFFFFNCLISLPDRIGYARVYTMDCMNNDIHHSYATLADYQTVNWMNFTKDHETLSSMSFTETCESWATEPVRADPEILYGYSEAGNYSEILKTGFILNYWSASNCNGCVESGGLCGFNDSMSQIMCLCRDRPQLGACPADNEKKRRKIKKIIIGVSAAAGGIFLICFFFFLSRVISSGTSGQKFWLDDPIFIWKKRTKDARNVEEFLKNYGSLILQRYRYSEIKKITNSFKDKLGQGGYGGVFKGKLFDGRLVAVKVLNETKGNGEEFINEVASIGRTYHVNIVTLLGFCSEGSKRALIYDFMPNGSLEKFIYGEKPRTTNHTLCWEKLYEIAVGIARGLEYLHRGCSTRILHFDIKPHNILLDQDFCPKISDFGLAKLCPTKDSIISMLDARGTVGYIAPEVFCRNFGGVSYKSDVYSYGMMVLEMVGGRRNFDAGVENASEIYFPQWIYKRLDLNKDLLLHGISTQVEEETARKMIIVGLWCVQTHPKNRPTISRVVEMLEGSLESLPMPPDPVLSSPSTPELEFSTTT